MLAGDWTPSFAVDGVVKDVGLMVEAAAAEGFPTGLLHELHELFAEAAAQGHGDDDMAAVRTVFP
jgi:3-hydroxyisobutyrate dehydrogenase